MKVANKDIAFMHHTVGRSGGRLKALSKEQRMIAVRLYKEKDHSIDQICRMMGVSRPTLYKYVNAEKASV